MKLARQVRKALNHHGVFLHGGVNLGDSGIDLLDSQRLLGVAAF